MAVPVAVDPLFYALARGRGLDDMQNCLARAAPEIGEKVLDVREWSQRREAVRLKVVQIVDGCAV